GKPAAAFVEAAGGSGCIELRFTGTESGLEGGEERRADAGETVPGRDVVEADRAGAGEITADCGKLASPFGDEQHAFLVTEPGGHAVRGLVGKPAGENNGIIAVVRSAKLGDRGDEHRAHRGGIRWNRPTD